jgi:hypothetical protein
MFLELKAVQGGKNIKVTEIKRELNSQALRP